MVAVSGIEPDPSEGMSLACSRYTSPHYASVVTRSEAQRFRVVSVRGCGSQRLRGSRYMK